jgi:conjugal transfer/type IV secretion protein DotA/TraY
MEEGTASMPQVHPLAALSSIGKALVENAIRSMATSLFFSFGGGMEGIMQQGLGAGLMAMSKMFVNVATIGLTAGFILYYILPFLPFLYFFFAVGAWVKSIFEAMVGAPLWALAHLRIDGDGFSGKAAAGGYFLLFEIFLRPIVTLFGLIGGMAIFGAMVAVLNEIFDQVVGNIVGAIPDPEGGGTIASGDYEITQMGAVDQFFFTIMYAILVYMMATSAFKLIDTIPKHVMQWLGTQVSTFNDNTGDPTANLSQYTAIAGNQIAPQILGGINQGGSAAGQLVSSAFRAASDQGQGGQG